MRPAHELVQRYFKAFERKDLATITDLLCSDVTLQDPFVGIVSGKAAVLAIYQGAFDAHKSIQLEQLRCFSSDTGMAAEFKLQLTNLEDKQVRLDGIDCFEFEHNLIRSIRAYLDLNPV